MDKYESFLSKISEYQIDLHGFIAKEGGKITKEWYKPPFGPDYPHRMYSVAKSFVSLAIGCLADAGTITLSDRVCCYFPEYEPEGGFYPEMQRLTIRDCLTMQTCHSKTTYRIHEDKDWAKTFFTVKPDHEPGCVFAYDTSAALVLGALVEKLTGKSLMDYLREQILDETGCSKEAHMQTAPGGHSHAGSGLVCTLPDLLKVAELIKNKGKWQDRQLISAEYLQEAVSFQTSTALQGNLDERAGYGYMIWRTRKPGYCLYGMGGQLALVFPDKDLIFACCADTQTTDGLPHLYDAFYDTIYAETGKRNPVKEGGELMEDAEKEDLDFDRDRDAVRMEFSENSMGLKEASLHFNERVLKLENEKGAFVISYGVDQAETIVFPGTNYKTLSKGTWTDDHTFLVKLNVIEEDFSPVFLEFGFGRDGKVSAHFKNTSEPAFLRDYSGFAGGTYEKKQKVWTNRKNMVR